MTTTDQTLATAIAAVSAACRVTRRVQEDLGAIRQHTKDDRSPVTIADYAAQAVIAHALAADAQSLALVGEEDANTLRADGSSGLRGAVHDAARVVWEDATENDVLDAIDLGNHDASGEAYWTLDPIDGTKGFLRGGQYAISLAYIDAGRVRLGIMGCPNLSADFERPFDQADAQGCLFFAARDKGAWWFAPETGSPQTAERIGANTSNDLQTMRVCESVEAAHSRLDDTARVVDKLGAKGAPARLDSQCKYAVVARGQADAYLRFPTSAGYVEKIWDHAAGQIVAEEAGAIVTDVHGQPLDFSKGATLSSNRGIVCTAPAFHAPVSAAIVDLGIDARR